jgi:hypothetical protein
LRPAAQIGDEGCGDSGQRYLDSVEVIVNASRPADPEHACRGRCPESHEAALLKIYMRLRPGNPANPEKAKQLFQKNSSTPIGIGWGVWAGSG